MKFSHSGYRTCLRSVVLLCVSVLAVVVGTSCSQASSGGNEKPIIVPSANIVMADVRTTNLIVKGDAMADEILAEYAPVSSFYGEQIFKDLVNVKFNPGLGENFSFENTIIGNYIDNTPKGVIVAVPATEENEIAGDGIVVTPGRFGPIVDEIGQDIKANALDAKVAIGYLTTELDTINSHIAYVQSGITTFQNSAKAITAFNEKYQAGLSDVTNILNNESLNKFVTDTASTLTKIQGGISELTTVLGKCGPVLNTICSVVDMFCGGSEKISSGEAEILAQLQAQFDKVFAQLDTIQDSIDTVDQHLADLGYTISTQDDNEIRSTIAGFRSALPSYIRLAENGNRTQLDAAAIEIDVWARGKLASLAQVAISRRAAYMQQLTSYAGTTKPELIALQNSIIKDYNATFTANVDIMWTDRTSTYLKPPTKDFKGNVIQTFQYQYPEKVVIKNPAKYLPTELEYLQYFASNMEWSYTVLDLIATDLDLKHQAYSDLATFYSDNIISTLRTELLQQMALQTQDFNAVMAEIDAKQTALKTLLNDQPKYNFYLGTDWVYDNYYNMDSLGWPNSDATLVACKYKNKDYWKGTKGFGTTGLYTQGSVGAINAFRTYWNSVGYPLVTEYPYEGSGIAYTLRAKYKSYGGASVRAVTPTNRSGAFQIMNADGFTGWDYPKEMMKVGVDTDAYWDGVKSIIKADYVQRSADMLHYAATLAAMELATKAWIID